MADYATEEEQLEALKRWWRENGRAVMLGIALGVLALAGWRGWEMHVEQRALEASAIYDALLEGVSERDYPGVSEHAETLRADYASTSYAALAVMAAAGLAVEKERLEAAGEWLRWAVDNADDHHLRAIARARLARVLAEGESTDEALDLLAAEVPSAYASLYAEIRGDLLHARGDHEAAASAYQQALDADPGPSDPDLVERKLNRVRGNAVNEEAGQSADTAS